MQPEYKVYDKVGGQIYPVCRISFAHDGVRDVTIIGKAPSMTKSGYRSTPVQQLVASRIVLKQYTGLKDKNGTEIYERDIVHVDQHYDGDCRIAEYDDNVIFSEGTFDGERSFGYDLPMLSINKYCEVIGNIDQNPELLK